MDLRGSVRICEHKGLSAVQRNGQTTNPRSQNYRFHNNAHGDVGRQLGKGDPNCKHGISGVVTPKWGLVTGCGAHIKGSWVAKSGSCRQDQLPE